MATPNTVQTELDAMIKTLGGTVKKEEPVVETTTEPIEVVPEVVEPEVVEPAVVETPTAVETPTIVDPKDQEIINLKAQLEELKAGKPVVETPTVPVTEPVLDKPIDFLAGLDIDDLTRDPEALNKFANQIYNKGLTSSSERVLASMPSLIQQQVVLIQQMEKTRTEFFSDNPDLEKFPKVVSTVFEEIQDKNKDKSFSEVLKLVAPEVRTRLGLKKLDKPEQKNKAPKLPSGGGKSGRAAEETPITGIGAEIEAMNKVIR